MKIQNPLTFGMAALAMVVLAGCGGSSSSSSSNDPVATTLSYDVAVTNLPATNFCEDYVVAWGQRNRIADPAVQARSLLAVSHILPERLSAVEDVLGNMPPPTLMTPGVNWCDNINLTASATGLSLPGRAAPTVERVRPFE